MIYLALVIKIIFIRKHYVWKEIGILIHLSTSPLA